MTKGWLATLLVVSVCATSSPAPADRTTRAATDVAKDEPPECGAPQADSLDDGLVVIRPGETICIAATAQGDAVTLTRVVPTNDGPARPIVFRSWREGSGVFLAIYNPFSRSLKYRAGVVLPGEVQPRDTSSCPVAGDYRQTRGHWPHPVDEILLTDFRLLADGAALTCE